MPSPTPPETEALAERLIAAGRWVSLDLRIREATAAEVLGVTVRTLARWREAGCSPPFVVIGRSLTYRLADLCTWIDSRRHAA